MLSCITFLDLHPWKPLSLVMREMVTNFHPPSSFGTGPPSMPRDGVALNLGVPHPDTTFKCDCGKTYGSVHNLKRHQRFACGVDPKFACPVCGKRFAYKFNMKQHYLMIHKK